MPPLWAIEQPTGTLFADDDRLVVAVDFEKAIVWIKWIGTHRAYDKIDVTEVRHGH
jgi:mRNA-degrading endonuclease HigB of HigAB toxin-antitoxin module